jgi:hypothetical protein
MAKRSKGRRRTVRATSVPQPSPGELERRDDEVRRLWQARQKRNLIAACVLGLGVVAASVGWSLHNEANNISTAVASGLGPTTGDSPQSPLGNFRRLGAEVKAGARPQVLMVGALGCDNCAAERWALVKALGRFGTWSDLKETTTASGIPTFDLTNASLSSWYVAVDHTDLVTVNHQSLGTLNDRERTLMDRYDRAGRIPLVIVGRYALTGRGVSPDGLMGHTFRTIQSSLVANASVGYARSINTEANLITAMLCSQDGGKPHVFCSSSAIRTITRRLR